jgi:PII-like signaling protein
MQGFQLTFYTQQNRRHAGHPLGEWLIATARSLGLRGATLSTAQEGFGHHGRLHAAHFFELADQPIAVTLAVSADEADRFFERLRQEQLDLFYVRIPIEFGMTGSRP